jgi:uncharacterized Fe-S cluster-containing radical SAM superfamily protein
MDTIIPDAPFTNPDVTVAGEPRASVDFQSLETLWLNTGTLCNLACGNCYIISSPTNDALVYLNATEACQYFDEIQSLGLGTREIGITGGEPFMNPDIITILSEALGRGFEVLVLTNAMKPMEHHRASLHQLIGQYGHRLTLRVSLDHYTRAEHEAERGPNSWTPTLDGLAFLTDAGATITLAGRNLTFEDDNTLRQGYQTLMTGLGINLDAMDPAMLVIFPEMDPSQPATEITTACWDRLNVRPEDQMCASARMVIKRKGADRPIVVACTLLAYEAEFEMGGTLEDSFSPVKLNHSNCSQFCVLGGASCS